MDRSEWFLAVACMAWSACATPAASPPPSSPSSAGRTTTAPSASSAVAATRAGDLPNDTRALADELRRLRAIPGHFGGGEWNDEVDRAGGRKEAVLGALGERLGDGTHTRAEVEALLGAPDDVFPRGDAMFRLSYGEGDPRVTELLVYRWRGLHDFLYFASDGVRVLSSGWWFAGE